MSDDDDLERRLQRYRPAGPRDGLRTRVLAPRFGRRDAAAWLAAAALLALAVSLHLLASRTHGRMAGMVGAGGLVEESAVFQVVVADLGDEDVAREVARRIVADRERRVQAEADAPAPSVEELWNQ